MTGFICQVDEECRSACDGLPFYTKHEGKQYCVLHYPGFKDKLLEFDEAVGQKIENNDYNFRGTWFPYSTAILDGEVIETDADFSFATFNKDPDPTMYEGVLDEDFVDPISFCDAKFQSKVHFRDTKFCTDVDFSNVWFGRHPDFSGAVFAGDANFNGDTFRYSAKFRNATFEGDASFTNAKFLRNSEDQHPGEVVVFAEAHFTGYADFSNAAFDADSVQFLSACFFDEVIFDDANFCQSTTVFSSAEFHGGVGFRDAILSGGRTYFKGTKFYGRADFHKTKLHGADFRESSFTSETTFDLAVFEGDRCDFSNLTFDKCVDFSQVVFDCPVYCATTIFGGKADFFRAEFKNVAVFEGANFLNPVGFREAHFGGYANFRKAIFAEAGSSVFQDATFDKHVNFETGQFGAKVSFLNATFIGPAWFTSTRFDKEIHCMGAVFRQEARFLHTRFCKHVDFSRAKFEAEAQFTGAEFTLNPIFHYVSFGGRTSFAGIVVNDNISFVEADFQDKVLFSGTESNRLFHPESVVSFQDVRVEKPELVLFDTVMLRPHWLVGLDVSRLNFTNVRWHGLFESPEGSLQDEIDALPSRYGESRHELISKTCRELYANYEGRREYRVAGEFHYWSMEALRKKSWKRLGLIGFSYWVLSGYGERPKRAFFILVGLWTAFAVLYALVGPAELQVSSSFWHLVVTLVVPFSSIVVMVSELSNAVELDAMFSVQELVSDIKHFGRAFVYSLGTMTRLSPSPKPDPGVFQFLVTIEGILGPIQIALLALAVRRKVMR